MRFKLFEAERDIRPEVGNRALKLISSRCTNLEFPTELNDPFYQSLITILEENTDGTKDLSLNSPFVKFLYNMNNNFTFVRKISLKDLFKSPDNMERFNTEVLPTLKDVGIFKPYLNCYDKSKKECSYLCKVIDGWFGNEFEKYFGNVRVDDIGIDSLNGDTEKLEQSDFGYLFTKEHLEQGTNLINSGLPNSTNLNTVYGMIEHLTDLNEAKVRGNIRRNKRSTASEDEIRDALDDITSNGAPLDDDASEKILTAMKFR